jgi:hypothetical protein
MLRLVLQVTVNLVFPDRPELEFFTICSLHRIRSFCNVLCANGGVVVDHSNTNMGGAPRAYTMTAQSVHIRRAISRSHAIRGECLILIELSRAIACCRIAKVKKFSEWISIWPSFVANGGRGTWPRFALR